MKGKLTIEWEAQSIQIKSSNEQMKEEEKLEEKNE